MGGIGSGRPSRSGRGKVEACRSIDVNRLNQEGYLTPGWAGGWQWTCGGEQVAPIQLRAEADRVLLSYRVRINGADWEDVTKPIPIVRVPCRLGGSRPYFICPGVVNGIACGRRVAKLYGSGPYFLCRHCYGLSYASQSECARDRILRRANGIRTRLGGEPGMLSPFPERPRGMWQRTYERLRERTFAAERQAVGAASTEVKRLLARLDQPRGRGRVLGMSDTITMLPGGSGSYELTRFNALRHGVLSRYTVLPWEDAGEYRMLLEALLAEHAPQGPTEEHLVEELAGIMWRRRRLRLAEAAAHSRGLERTLDAYRKTVKAALVHLGAEEQGEDASEAIRATAEETVEELADVDADEAMTRHALDLLGAGEPHAYGQALTALHEDSRSWWEEVLALGPDDLEEDAEPYSADSTGLKRFLEEELLPWYTARRRDLANRPLVREQAFGEALDPDKLERLGRYEVHLDRKLGRNLAMLLKLKDLRRSAGTR